jgi:DNA-binding CsgD family transcriptional regulator
MEFARSIDPTRILNDTEYALLVQWAKELSREQIADEFNRSGGWVDKTIGIIYNKLGVHTRQGAIDKAWRMGIFTQENRK